ncbi:4Fe-4S dicluster domain-containing protein [Halobacteria archaeon AArc-m2/3/4]|uniref:Ferredoxin-like protein n=1 Tax=Natronoglomus mannanivorans TaxID=2979990 RepID=A0AAP2Z511_9EURY|nr:4Fe-4S dicluster domain-containing protein [Halobacteria archaeon AArc-xg1-1]MCU4975792.1 4Fe-4S dicluster domain-containing protein [Halobacteria archaeon AArc-m2/3/4]
MSVQPDIPTVTNDSMEDRLYTVKYDDPGESHLDVKVSDVCASSCDTNDCASVCPANVWRETEDGVPQIAYENCLECSSCRFACPYDNVVWEYPETGAGVTFKHG